MQVSLRRIFMTFGLLLGCTAALWAQSPEKPEKQTLNELLSARVAAAQKLAVDMAEAMPAEKYNFVPSQGEYKGVRNFAEQIHHISTGNYYFGSAILGEQNPLSEADRKEQTTKNKDELIKELNDSFAYLDKAMKGINEENMLDVKPSPRGKPTRLGAAIGSIAHVSDIYGQCVEYLRLNGIVPPASRK